MKLKGTLIGAAMLLVAAAPASAGPLCVGTQETVVQCVDPTGARVIDDCVYVGPPPCHPVVVDGPYVYCLGGRIGEQIVSCA
jgi:hypothetical protein